MLGAGLPIDSGPGPDSFPPPLDGRILATEAGDEIATEDGLLLEAEAAQLLAAQDGDWLACEDGTLLAVEHVVILATQADGWLATEDGKLLVQE
jgi:hypothetical protein